MRKTEVKCTDELHNRSAGRLLRQLSYFLHLRTGLPVTSHALSHSQTSNVAKLTGELRHMRFHRRIERRFRPKRNGQRAQVDVVSTVDELHLRESRMGLLERPSDVQLSHVASCRVKRRRNTEEGPITRVEDPRW